MAINLFFDFDMTLGYRIMMWRDTVKELLLEEGATVSVDDIKSFSEGKGYPWSSPFKKHKEFFKGKEWWQYVEEFIHKSLIDIVDDKRAVSVSKKFKDRYLDFRYWGVFPDTLLTLKELKNKGYKLYILSNHVPEAKDLINKMGLTHFFEKIFISADLGVEKPNPEIYKIALSYTNKIDYNIMIGDNYEADIKGSINAGFNNAILVRKPNIYNYPYYSRYLNGIMDIIKELINENR